MPAEHVDPREELTEDSAEDHARGVCFKTGPPARIGVELEWLVQDRSDPRAPIPAGRLDAALAPVEASGALPRGSRLTREPGGQVELSSPPAATPAECVAAAAEDLAVLREAIGRAGLRLVGNGLDPYRDPPRIVEQPRYRAMERFFDGDGPAGRVMMRRTASLQVNLDSGEEAAGPAGYRFRWALTHRLGPVLVAVFANSPFQDGRPTGWMSTRQAVWGRIDPGRARPPRLRGEPRATWARYALDARVLCVRAFDGSPDWSAPAGLTFRDWVRGAAGLRRPTVADLDYHLSTLFPPVRPRGWLELRMIDAQSGDDWVVPTLLTAILLDDPAAAEAAHAATEPLCAPGEPAPADDIWRRAARIGLADPELAKAARSCFAAADSALARTPTPPHLRRALSTFADRYADRGRSPAHTQLDALTRA